MMFENLTYAGRGQKKRPVPVPATAAECRQMARRIINQYGCLKFKRSYGDVINKIPAFIDRAPAARKRLLDGFIAMVENAFVALSDEQRDVLYGSMVEGRKRTDYAYSSSAYYRILAQACRRLCELVLWW